MLISQRAISPVTDARMPAFHGISGSLVGMTPSAPLITDRRCTILLALAFVVGIGEAWWGASALFTAGVEADLRGSGGGFDLIPLTAVLIGTASTIGTLCALAWQLGLFLQRRREELDR